MIKPDALWNFFLSAPDGETIGRVCMALADRRDELDSPLNKFEESYVREIVQSAEWYDEATDRVAKRKRKNYLLEKKRNKGLAAEEQSELDEIQIALSIKPSLALKAGVSSAKSAKPTRTAKSAKSGEVGEIGKSGKSDFSHIHPSVHPSVRPSVQNNNKEDIFFSPKPPKGADDAQDEVAGVRGKGSDEFQHVSREQIANYFKRMRANGGKNSSEELEDAFWQYLVAADFKKGDGMPIQGHNMHSTFTVWLNNMRRDERKETADKAAQEAKEREDMEREERIQKMLLSEDED